VKRILVLGGGAQGRVIAADLARSLPEAHVRVADRVMVRLPPAPNLAWCEADLANPSVLERRLAECDLAVGALPSRLGDLAMRAAIAARRPMVDVSFAAESPLPLDTDARAAGVFLIPDCGLAPGLSHLIAGRLAAQHGSPRSLTIYVGGVAEDRSMPYGYVVTWSPEDLLEEYRRPARVRRGGRVVERPVFDELETLRVEGVGEMEAFLSDGLRTLLETLPEIPEMSEKTLRWPGHAAAVKPLLGNGRFLDEIRGRCAADPPRDMVVLLVRARWNGAAREVLLVDHYDEATGLTAMSRTTALTTAAVAGWAARGRVRETGVLPLERMARDRSFYDFVIEELGRRGVGIRPAALA
jgi:saccharopine dehydrogenase-like NADP-dependent oxidoreductase